jgi:hypothetical protein
MIGTGNRAGCGRQDQLPGFPFGRAWRQSCAVIAAPVAAFVTPAAASPQLTGYHASAGTVAPDMTTYHS